VLCGIIDEQQGWGDEERETASMPSAVSLFAKSVAAITKAVEYRPVADWTDHECEQVASMYAPILAVIDEVESRGA
jgi:hypothetical protein